MSHIRRNMKEENTDYRPEQMYCAKLLRELLPQGYEVLLEYPVKNLDHPELGRKAAILDIVVLGMDDKYGIRLMGEIHDSKKKQIKDMDQKIALIEYGWVITDFSYYGMPELWDQKKYTKQEAKDSITRNFKL